MHEGNKAEYLFLKRGTIPDPNYTYNAKLKISQTIIERRLEGGSDI